MKYFSSLILTGSILFAFAQFEWSNSSPKQDTQTHNKKEIQAPSNCPASPYSTQIVQSDGTSIDIIGKGNMNNSWTETTDGYTIIPVNGIYQYAQKVAGNLQPTGIKANNPGNRNNAELSYLASVQKGISPDFDPLKNSVLNQVNAQLSNKTYPTTGNLRILAILIDYPDLNSQFPKSNFDSLLYGSNYRSGDGSFKTFYETASNGNVTVNIDVMGWYRAANGYLYYSRDSGYSRAADLAREAVVAADGAGANFANYDNDNDGDVDGILVVHAGPGAEQGSRTQYIWSHRWVLQGSNQGPITLDGKFINDYMMNPETRIAGPVQNMVGIGVFCHEFGHNLGLPDLYDTDPANGDSEGIGNWCLMAGGGWLGGEHRPINFSAWCRLENNWDTPTIKVIGTSSSDTLQPASTTQNEIYRVNTSVPTEYFLLENRQKVGLDLELPGEGLAIWHINTTKTNASGNSVNADENLKGVDLEEADGNNDLDNEVNRGDAGDLFPGSSNNTSFDDNTNPNARNYSLAASNLQIRNITELGTLLSFDFGPPVASCSGGTTTFTAATGTFNDGSAPSSNYANNLNCSWLIQPTGATSITLNFNRFDVDNTIDRVAVYDGSSFSAPLIGTYTGTTIPATIVSTGSSLYIEFTTNGSNAALGWEATYTSNVSSSTCSGNTTLNSASGSFDDGSGANVYYSNNLNCSWTVSPAGASVIQLVFDSLDLGLGDTLFVYDGNSSSSNLLGSYTGNTLPASLLSSGSNAFVEFISNASDSAKGWQITYQGISGCSGLQTLTAAAGIFSDGSAPGLNYSPNLNCAWLIQPTGANFISLSFNRFSTESGFDFVEVFDGPNSSSPSLGQFSGTSLPPVLTSTGNSLYVEFDSDFLINDLGWEAAYSSTTSTCLPNRVLTTNNGTISDGSGTSNYDNNTNCSWLIQPTLATSISLSFSSFDTESGNDVVNIYDGTNNSGTLLGSYSGNTLPPVTTITGTNKSMFVEFISNSTTTAAGWSASYTSSSAITCSGVTTFTAPSGSFEDGSGPGFYDPNLNCGWLIQPTGTVASITLTMTAMALANFGDRVRVYDGINNAGTPIGFFNGTNLGNPVTAFSGSMFVEFITDANIQGQGFSASYTSSSTYCSTGNTFTATAGNFTDGSPLGSNYLDNSDCSWLIQPAVSNVAVRLTLFQFDTEAINDTVTVYDGTSTSDPILGTYSGNLGTLPSITSSGGDMLVTFKSNGSTTASGWRASYNTQPIPACAGLTNLSAATGTFSDGSAATANYVENSNCQWLIQPAGANIVTLSFNRFNTQNSFDFVRVYDGSNNSAPLLGTFSGTTIPPTINSSGGSLFVEFISNGFTNSTGWEATYNSSSSQCFNNLSLTAFSDTIQDGSGSSNYSNNLSCSWLIQPPTALSINLSFLNFNLDNSDSLKVYDGSNSSASLIGAYTGSNLPSAISSSGGTLYLEFITDGSLNAQGWRAVYTINSSLSCVGTTTLTAVSGNFNDGSGTGLYDNNLQCGWLIQPTGNPAVIVLTMNSMALANFGDFVRVYDGVDNTGNIIASYFGTNTGNPVSAFSGSMFVEFITDNFTQGQGWNATYSSSSSYCAPNTTLTNNFGSFTDGSPFGSNYLNNTNCQWLIQPTAPNVAVRLNLFQFNTEAGFDSVTVYDGSTTADPILGSFSGNLGTIPAVVSSGGSMLVTFDTDGNTTRSGWRASYGTQPIPFCSGNTSLTASSGTFDDGSGQNVNYVQNSNCSWLIQPSAGAVTINLSFNYFDTQGTFDLVNVYDGPNNTSPSLGVFSGNSIPPTLAATSGSMFIEFITNGGFQLDGWEATYTSSNTFIVDASPDTVYINAGLGSTSSFSVNSNTTWRTSDNANWLIVSPFNGSQSQTANLLATQPNIGPQRFAEVYINGTVNPVSDTVIVVQRASGNFLDASPDTLFFAANPASSQNATINSSVSWNLTASNTWLSVNPSSGLNNGAGAVSVQQNTSTNTRTGFIVASGNLGVANDTVFVKQAGRVPPPPGLSVNPNSLNLAFSAGSSDQFTVNSTVVWQTSSPASWLAITNPANTSDTNTVLITATSANPGTSPRTSYVAVQDVGGTLFDTVFVSQAGSPPIPASLSVNPKALVLNQMMNSLDSFMVNSTVNWMLSSPASWITLNPPANQVDTGKVEVVANSANTGTGPRTSFVAIQDMAGTLFDTVIVSQLGTNPSLIAVEDTLFVAATTGSTVNLNLVATGSWISNAGASWFNQSPSIGTGNASIVVTANSDNNTGLPRISYLALEDPVNSLFDTAIIVQDYIPVGPPTTSPDTIRLAGNAGSQNTYNVLAGLNVNWQSNPDDNWISLSPSSGTGSATVTVISNSANPSTSAERMTFIVTSDISLPIPDTIYVIQEPGAANLSVSPSTLSLGFANGSNANIQVNANVNWTVTNPVTWLSLSANSGSGNSSLTVTANSDNLTGSNRTATLSFDSPGLTSQTVQVTQIDGSNPNFALSLDTLYLNNAQGSTGQFAVQSNVLNWTLSENASWLLINPQSEDNTENITALAASRNSFGNPRMAIVKASVSGFPDDSIVVIQRGASPLFQVAPNSLVLGGDSSAQVSFNVSSNLISWMAEETSAWMEISTQMGSFSQRITVTAIDSNNTGDVRRDTITVSAPPLVPQIVEVIQDTAIAIGINKSYLSKASMSLYPNPNAGEFRIEIAPSRNLSEARIEIYDLLGKQVPFNQTFISNSMLDIDMADQAPGIYFINIQFGQERLSKKITVLDR